MRGTGGVLGAVANWRWRFAAEVTLAFVVGLLVTLMIARSAREAPATPRAIIWDDYIAAVAAHYALDHDVDAARRHLAAIQSESIPSAINAAASNPPGTGAAQEWNRRNIQELQAGLASAGGPPLVRATPAPAVTPSADTGSSLTGLLNVLAALGIIILFGLFVALATRLLRRQSGLRTERAEMDQAPGRAVRRTTLSRRSAATSSELRIEEQLTQRELETMAPPAQPPRGRHTADRAPAAPPRTGRWTRATTPDTPAEDEAVEELPMGGEAERAVGGSAPRRPLRAGAASRAIAGEPEPAAREIRGRSHGPAARDEGTAAGTRQLTLRCRYVYGDDDFDEVLPITDRGSGVLLGGCGVSSGLALPDTEGSESYVAFVIWVQDNTSREGIRSIGVVSRWAETERRAELDEWRRRAGFEETEVARVGRLRRYDDGELAIDVTLEEVVFGTQPGLPRQSFFEVLAVRFDVTLPALRV